MQNRVWLKAALIAPLTFALFSCSDDDDDSATVADAEFTLQLLHVADMDGASGALDNVDQFSALVSKFQAEYPDTTLTLSSGDNFIPGPRFFASSDDRMSEILGIAGNGRADIAFLNAMGFQASAVGNHDLDQGTEAFAGIIAASSDAESGAAYAGASFPYLSSNLDFSTDENLQTLIVEDANNTANGAGKVAASATITVDSETIGIVGATTPRLASITSAEGITVNPSDANDMNALAAEIQPAVDALVASGINKVILLAHMQQISIEKSLAPLLDNVDIIVAGGSNTLLADSNDILRSGDTAADTYPLQLSSKPGDPVLIVNTDGDYKYLGRLVVGFDADGKVLPSTLDDRINGAWAATDEVVTAQSATANTEVTAVSAALRQILADRDGNILGKTDVYLDGRRSQVRTQETNLGNMTADANLWLARQADSSVQVSLKNGGGIRAEIGVVYQPPGSTDSSEVQFLPPPANADAGKEEGDISQFAIEGTLRFNNGLSLLTLTATELVDILEHSVAATADGSTPGQFPQVAGLRFSFDPTQQAREGGDENGDVTTAGNRLINLAIVKDDGTVADVVLSNGVLQGDANRQIRIVTLDFIVKCVPDDSQDCGDGYPYKGLASPNYVALSDAGIDPGNADFADAGSEQDALAEYLMEKFSETAFDKAETPVEEDVRIQNMSVRVDDTVLQ